MVNWYWLRSLVSIPLPTAILNGLETYKASQWSIKLCCMSIPPVMPALLCSPSLVCNSLPLLAMVLFLTTTPCSHNYNIDCSLTPVHMFSRSNLSLHELLLKVLFNTNPINLNSLTYPSNLCTENMQRFPS